MPTSGTLTRENKDTVAYVTFNRPAVLNAMNHELRTALTQELEILNDDESVRCVVLRGSGRAFCAGQDQNESKQFTADAAARRIQTYLALFRAIRNMNKPVIASIRGYAVGAGLQIASLADIRVAASGSKFALPELNIGAPAITGSGLLWPIVGEAAVKRLVLTSEFIESDEALRLSLVHEVVPDEALDSRIDELSSILADRPPLALRLCKEWWRDISKADFERTSSHAVGAHAASFASGELSAGAKQFVERKRV